VDKMRENRQMVRACDETRGIKSSEGGYVNERRREKR